VVTKYKNVKKWHGPKDKNEKRKIQNVRKFSEKCQDFMTFLNFTNFQTFLYPTRVNFLTFFTRNKMTKNNFEKSDIFTRNQPGLGTSFGCERKIEVKHISTM